MSEHPNRHRKDESRRQSADPESSIVAPRSARGPGHASESLNFDYTAASQVAKPAVAVDPRVLPAEVGRSGLKRGVVAGWGLVAVGLAIAVLGMATVLGDGWVETLVSLIGLVLLFSGAARIGRHYAGDRFDLTGWLCIIWLALLLFAAVFAPLLPFSEATDISKTITSPSLSPPDPFTAHPLGTNNFGLDLLGRVVYGARVSLVVAVGAVAIGTVVGGVLGILAGFFRRTTDTVIGISTNTILAVPPLILLIALATVLETNLRNIAFALSILAAPSMVRMARASTLTFAQREFVLAARAMGASRMRLMARELFPNVLLPLLSYGMVMISVLIVAEASLSFLGLGVQPPRPSWGNMIAEAEGDVLTRAPFIALVPGGALFLTVFSFNLLGEKARQRFDTRQAKL